MSDAVADAARLALLEELELLTDTPEEGYDRYTRLAAELLGAPVTLFTVVTPERQLFRSHVGLEEPWATTRETPISHSFCQHVVRMGSPMRVVDAREDPVVRDNPAIEDMGVVSYLGVPLITRKGERLGSLCGIEHEPREWTRRDERVLKDLAAATVTEIELRRTTREAVALAEELARMRS